MTSWPPEVELKYTVSPAPPRLPETPPPTAAAILKAPTHLARMLGSSKAIELDVPGSSRGAGRSCSDTKES